MTTAVVYVHVCGVNADADATTQNSAVYARCAERFVRTYRQFDPGCGHELMVVFANPEMADADYLSELYRGCHARFTAYHGTGWCSGAHQHAARTLARATSFAVCLSARTHFWKAGWLARLVSARERHGAGFYGTMSSDEASRHLRTNCYGLDPRVLAEWPHPLDRREATWELEHGEWNLSRKFHEEDRPSKLVTWSGEWDYADWRRPDNIFRRGDQSGCLVWDRHTDAYQDADGEGKRRLEDLAEGRG